MTFTPDTDFPHVCITCGWADDHHKPHCPYTCNSCGHMSFECRCEDGEISFKSFEQSLAELQAQEELDLQ